MITLSTKELSYYDRVFSTEASTLEHLHPTWMAHRNIELKSHKTGATRHFNYEGNVRDNEGEIQSWQFINKSDGLKIIVFND